MADLHLTEACLDDADVFALKTALVDLLLARRSRVCPACITALLLDLAAEGSELWDELNAVSEICRH